MQLTIVGRFKGTGYFLVALLVELKKIVFRLQNWVNMQRAVVGGGDAVEFDADVVVSCVTTSDIVRCPVAVVFFVVVPHACEWSELSGPFVWLYFSPIREEGVV